MSVCSNCGKDLPAGAAFCPECGGAAVEFTLPHTDVTPSDFNSGMTISSQPQTVVAQDNAGFAVPPAPSPEEKKRPGSGGRRKLMFAIIAILAVLLVGATVEAGFLGPNGTAGGTPINSPSTPLTGEQLYAAYTANQTQASASYTNKTLYIQDSLDFGVNRDYSGQYFSSVNSGTVILIWSAQAQVDNLYPGSVVLAKCSVQGLQATQGAGYLLYLQGCVPVSVQSQTATASSLNVPSNNL